MSWIIKISPKAVEDIQNTVKWYNKRQTKLGKRFKKKVIA